MDGFTVVLLALKSDQRRRHHHHHIESCTGIDDDGIHLENENETDSELVAEVVATGSVKLFDDEDRRIRAQQHWIQPPARGCHGNRTDVTGDLSINKAVDGFNVKLKALYRERKHPHRVHELQALAVSPKYQGVGLGARLLEIVEWLVRKDGDGVLEIAKGVGGGEALFVEARLVSEEDKEESEVDGRVGGIDLDRLRSFFEQVRRSDGGAGSKAKRFESDDAHEVEVPLLGQLGQRKLVLVAIREIGNEEYYLRWGLESVGTRIPPSGTWGSEAECTMVYMENVSRRQGFIMYM